MTDSVDKINRRFKLLNMSFESLKTYFDEEIPNSINFESHFFNMASNYSAFLNNIMAILDSKDNSHPNSNKDKKTGFNAYDLKKKNLPKSIYNDTQIAFLKGVKELFVIQCSFNKNDIKNWLNLKESADTQVDLIYTELKTNKFFKEKNQSLFGQIKIDSLKDFKIKFRNNKLSAYGKKIQSEISKLLHIEEETTLEIFRNIRNEEEHFALTKKNIISNNCYKIGTSSDFLVLINENASASFENCSFALDFNKPIELTGMKICDLGKNSLNIDGTLSFNNYLLTNKKKGWKSNLITVNNILISKKSFYISEPSFDSFVFNKKTQKVALKNCTFIIRDKVCENISFLYENNKFTDISDNEFFKKNITEYILTTHTITLDKNGIEINAKELAEQLFDYSNKLYELYLKT
jgi:hypothetical protein|tara:strand:- start:2034 stop:3254 length:1221 start_codon:yes stop_codon:yes gene_type:complete